MRRRLEWWLDAFRKIVQCPYKLNGGCVRPCLLCQIYIHMHACKNGFSIFQFPCICANLVKGTLEHEQGCKNIFKYLENLNFFHLENLPLG